MDPSGAVRAKSWYSEGEQDRPQRPVDVVLDAFAVRSRVGIAKRRDQGHGADGRVVLDETMVVIDEPAAEARRMGGDRHHREREYRQPPRASHQAWILGTGPAVARTRPRCSATSPTGIAAMHVGMRQRLER